MASIKDYIPATILGFHNWQINLVGRVVLNAATWNIDPLEVTDLQAQQGIYTPLYTAATTEATKTKGAIYGLKQQTKLYKKYIRNFVKTHLAFNPAVTGQQKIDLKINPGGNAPSPRPHILTAPNVVIKSKGNLLVVIECRVDGDSSRPSIHPDANGVELRGSIGTVPPANFEDTIKLGISSKARINYLTDDPLNAGKTI